MAFHRQVVSANHEVQKGDQERANNQCTSTRCTSSYAVHVLKRNFRTHLHLYSQYFTTYMYRNKNNDNTLTANSNSFIQTLKSLTIQSSRKDKILQRKENMLILQRRGHNSPCMQRGQSFLGVKHCSKDHTKFPKLSAEHQNLMMVHVTTEAD